MDSNTKKILLLQNFEYFNYSKRDHFDIFRKINTENFLNGNNIDIDNCDLKIYQNLLIYCFIKEHIPLGAKILEIGGGYSHIINSLKDKYEFWNIDKLEGIGNGPTEVSVEGYKLIKDYIGNFNKELPDNYFDFVFSISVFEHFKRDNLYENIINDIFRVMKSNSLSLHTIDCSSFWFHSIIHYIFKNLKTINNLIECDAIYQDNDLFFLPEYIYNINWLKHTHIPYKDFGKTFSYNILWKKE
jgi:hypothetical protein